MRAVLCLRPPTPGGGVPVPSRCTPGRPGPPPVLARAGPAPVASAALTARSEAGADGVLYCALPDAPTWAAQVGTARTLLARLPGGAGAPAASAGLATGRFPAACAAASAAPGTLRAITPGQEAAALAPLPLTLRGAQGRLLLPGLSDALRRELQILRVHTLGDLAALPAAVLTGVFGPDALRWQALARGEDTRPVGRSPTGGAPALAVHLALPPATVSRPLRPADLDPPARDLAAMLAAAGRAARTLQATVGFVDGAVATRTAALTRPEATAAAVHAAAWPLVAALLRARRRRPAWIALAAIQTTTAAVQPPLPLPPAPAERAARLAATISGLQQRFGPHVIGYGPQAPCR